MTTEHEDHQEADHSTQRIEAFSDGVFAIAITLLIIEIGVPHLDGGQSLGDALADLWPSYGAYALSFLTIGIYWANHHSLFKLFVRTDHIFLMFNVFFLMAVAFLPFPTAVLGEHLRDESEKQAAVGFYAFGLLLPALGWVSMWLYANVRGLVDDRLTPEYLRSLTVQYILSIIPYVLAVAASFLSGWVGLGICVGFTLLYLLPPRRPRYR